MNHSDTSSITLMPRATSPRKAKMKAEPPRRRDTGPTKATREIVLDRAAGCCEL